MEIREVNLLDINDLVCDWVVIRVFNFLELGFFWYVKMLCVLIVLFENGL